MQPAIHNYQHTTIRNKLLADAFYLMGDIEKYGTGFVRIRQWLKDYPEIAIELSEIGDFFRIELLLSISKDLKKDTGEPEKLPEKLSDLQQVIIDKMLANPKVTYLQLASIRGKSKEAIRKNIDKLKKMGLVRRIGPAKGGHWQPILHKKKR